MHPDQSTPSGHRYSASDSQASRPQPPEADQDDDAIDPEDDAAPAAQEVDEGARVAEAGNAYVGREMDDSLKSSPRVEDGDEAVDEDPTTPGDD
ncbi:hypothetical protein [Rubrivirga marina]|uniref:Uncharacterized protein n=1 Tax=Rubrivirga marina TaxID=1196024 RepID=A0A271IYH1_9BACT|nr:hypothetical protein [Rubrivirga marina]PAP76263.1 hypothetical protein BSZ37_07295 [Rubrivirga marina]